MSKSQTKDLLLFLKPFDKDVRKKALWLREFVWDLYPNTNELIYDNYNAVAFGWSPTDRVSHVFCSIALGRTSKNVHFGFYWGSKLSDPDNLLIGQGKQYRYILVDDINNFPKAYIRQLLKQAFAYSLGIVKDKSQLSEGLTITKSISAVKRTLKKSAVNKENLNKKK
ncbi:MAG TPA: hypothetical protein VM012_02595 [Flavitalea sp.]|nr:hypothetical protein [Flavitalea sp.]